MEVLLYRRVWDLTVSSKALKLLPWPSAVMQTRCQGLWSKEELGESGKRDPAVMQYLGKKPLGVLHVAQMDGLHIKD